MKKIYALILAVIMIISLFGCANGKDPVGTTDPTVTAEATLGDHEHDHGEVTKPVDGEQDETTEPTENSTEPSTEATTEPTDGETDPHAPDDIGNGGVEDLPEHPNTEPAPTQPAHKHDYKSKVVNPTCDSKGYTEYTCTCGDSYKSDYKDAKGHDYKSKTVAPTCESKGYTKYTCNACGKSYKDNEKSATGHNYKTETIAPTQDSKGYDLHTCKNCGKSYKDNYTDKLPAPTEHQHEWVWTEYVGPYACREGYNLYTCACGESYKEGTGDVLECDWQVDHVVEPTTESEGYTVYKCSVCGNTWTDYDRPKLPAPTEPAPTKPAECTNHSAGDGWLDTLPHHMEGYMVKCKCAPDVDFHADTKDGAVALHSAHKAECAGDGANHEINGIYEEWYIETPMTFECVHCGETCATYKYYKWSATHYAVMIYNG